MLLTAVLEDLVAPGQHLLSKRISSPMARRRGPSLLHRPRFAGPGGGHPSQPTIEEPITDPVLLPLFRQVAEHQEAVDLRLHALLALAEGLGQLPARAPALPGYFFEDGPLAILQGLEVHGEEVRDHLVRRHLVQGSREVPALHESPRNDPDPQAIL